MRVQIAAFGSIVARWRNALCLMMLSLAALGCAVDDATVGEAAEEVEAVTADEAKAERLDKGGAANTCFNWRPSGTGPLGGPNSVVADCRTVDGRYVTSQAWLPGCVGNINGNLVHGGQYFDRACNNCGLHTEFRPARYRFVCQCRRIDGGWQTTNIPISDYLTNINGQLVCD